MFNEKTIILAKALRPDLNFASPGAEELIWLKIASRYASGNPVRDAVISNGIAYFDRVSVSQPLVSLKLNIPITQSGSGTPSPDNIRDFIGVSGVQIFRGGVNLLESTPFENDTILTADGGTEESTGYITYDFIDVSNMSTIAIRSAKEATAGRYFRVCGYDSTKTFTTRFISQIRRDGEFTDYIDVSDVDYIRICWANNTTLFEAYNGNTYQISFGQTVYSANLDVLTGKLSITHGIVDLGDLEWKYTSTTTRFYTDDITDISLEVGFTDMFCSGYNVISSAASFSNMPDKSIKRGQSSSQISIRDLDYTDKDLFTASVTGMKLVYELAEPIEIDITPTVINTLIGENVIFADVANVTECKYTRK